MEREPQIDATDKKIRSSHRLRRIIASGEGAILGGVGYLANTIHVHHDLPAEGRVLLFVPLLASIFAGAGLTVTLENNEERLRSSNKKTSEKLIK